MGANIRSGKGVSISIATSQGVAADGTLTLTANIADTETVTIDTKVYTFEATLTDIDGSIQIGATLAETLVNLRNAINLTGVAGTDYGASTTIHPTAMSSAGPGDNSMIATAKITGTAGNSISTTSTSANATWSAVTLAGGDGANGAVPEPGTPTTIPAYEDFTFTVISEVSAIPNIGGTDAQVRWEPLEGTVQKAKGNTDNGTVDLTIALDYRDDGQLAVFAARETVFSYPFEVTLTDQNPGGTPTILFFYALVMSNPVSISSVNDVNTVTVQLDINSSKILRKELT